MSKSDQIRALREKVWADRLNSDAQKLASQDTVNNVTHVARVTNAKSNVERQTKWRKANPDLNRQRAREGMRKIRAAKKSNACA